VLLTQRCTEGFPQALTRDPDVRRGERGGLVRVALPDRREDRAVLAHRVLQVAAQGQRLRLEPAGLGDQAPVHLDQLLVSAELAQQVMERDVGREEVGDRVLLRVLGHLVHEFAQAVQVCLGHPRHGQPDGEHLQRFPDLVGVHEFAGRNSPDLGAAPRPHRHKAVGREPAHRLAYWAPADRQLLGQRYLGQLGARRQAIRHDLAVKVLIHPLPQR
jgi:hypothetical protein